MILLAESWGVPPWVLETDDLEQSRWVRRGLIYHRLMNQAEAAAQRNQAAKWERQKRRG